MRAARRALRLLSYTALLFLAVTCTPLAHYYSLPLLPPDDARKSDAIVLLSSGQLDETWLTPDASQRTLAALKLYREGYGAVIVSSGSQGRDGYRQAEVQAEWLRRAGVPADRIVVESRSTRTYESAVEVARLMRENAWSAAVVVTSRMDAPRVRRVFAKQRAQISIFTVREFGDPDGLVYYPYGPAVFYHATYEYCALLLYRFKGWI
jgi:uncharacterized SAM-binding protein YcdF (DUF218 family)